MASELGRGGRSMPTQGIGSDAGSLPAPAIDAIQDVMASRGGVGAVVAMPLPSLVADHTTKFMVSDAAGTRAAVVIISPQCDPDAVTRAQERSRQARAQLGDTLGGCVLTPWHVGWIDGLAYSVTAYGRPLRGAWSRWQVGPAVLGWLEAATRMTRRPLAPGPASIRFAEALRRLASHPALGARCRLAAERSAADLAQGEWVACQVLAHFDLWSGNLLWAPRGSEGSWPFAIIDWGASRTDGFAAYDLLRLADSLRLRPPALARQLSLHAAALGCPPAHMRHHLMAALAHLADHLGEWPAESFARTADGCLDSLDRALASSQRRGSD